MSSYEILVVSFEIIFQYYTNTLILNFSHTNQQYNQILEANEHHNHVMEVSGENLEILLSPDFGVERRKGHHI